jgi:hypothetical protein
MVSGRSEKNVGRDPRFASDAPRDPSEELRTFLTVSRTDVSDSRARQVVVTVDDEPKTTLLFGQSFTREIPPGSHRLRAHNTLFWKTIRFAVEPGEHLEFVVINKAGPLAMAILGVFGAAPLYLSIKQRSLR